MALDLIPALASIGTLVPGGIETRIGWWEGSLEVGRGILGQGRQNVEIEPGIGWIW